MDELEIKRLKEVEPIPYEKLKSLQNLQRWHKQMRMQYYFRLIYALEYSV